MKIYRGTGRAVSYHAENNLTLWLSFRVTKPGFSPAFSTRARECISTAAVFFTTTKISELRLAADAANLSPAFDIFQLKYTRDVPAGSHFALAFEHNVLEERKIIRNENKISRRARKVHALVQTLKSFKDIGPFFLVLFLREREILFLPSSSYLLRKYFPRKYYIMRSFAFNRNPIGIRREIC